jgi:hypothetical protein
VSKDSDYGTTYSGKLFLNAALYDELAQLYQAEPPVFCFDNIAEGLKDFADKTGTRAEKLPTPEETQQIKKEQESLPPLAWLTTNYDEALQILLLHDALRQKDSIQLRAALANVVNSEEAIQPPESENPDKNGA